MSFNVKFKRFIDKTCDDNDFDLITYQVMNMFIQKFRCDDEYSVFIKLSDTKNIIQDYRYLKSFKTLKEAKEYTYNYLIENL